MDLSQLTAQQIARLIQLANGGEDVIGPTVDGAKLHAEKNAPWVQGFYSDLLGPDGRPKGTGPYVHQPYPKMLFNAQYLRQAEQYGNALRLRAKRGDDEKREYLIAQARDAMQACTRIVQSAEDQASLGSLWCESPTEAVAAQETFDRAIAEAAAVSNFDDRRLGEQARAEREALDAASEAHVVEVPHTPIPVHQKKRGRPAKKQETMV